METKSDWRDLFKDNWVFGSGMQLNFSPPSIEFVTINGELVVSNGIPLLLGMFLVWM